MSAVAAQAVRECFAVLGIEQTPLRHEWRRGVCEWLRLTYRRRRAMLTRAGCHTSSQYREWDELHQSVRDALAAHCLD